MSVKSKTTGRAIFRSLRPEFFIMIAIITLVCWQLGLENMLSNDGALTMGTDGSFYVVHDRESSRELIAEGRALADFNLDTCRIIAVYNSNMDKIWKISFVDNADILYDDNIYPDDVKTGVSREGSFTFTASDGNNVRAVYKWHISKNGNEFLTVYTSSITKEEMKIQQVAIYYAVIILCFIMLANVTYWQVHGITNKYRKLMFESMRSSIR